VLDLGEPGAWLGGQGRRHTVKDALGERGIVIAYPRRVVHGP
jgi:hypothetical protein